MVRSDDLSNECEKLQILVHRRTLATEWSWETPFKTTWKVLLIKETSLWMWHCNLSTLSIQSSLSYREAYIGARYYRCDDTSDWLTCMIPRYWTDIISFVHLFLHFYVVLANIETWRNANFGEQGITLNPFWVSRPLVLNRCFAKLWKPSFFFYYYHDFGGIL